MSGIPFAVQDVEETTGSVGYLKFIGAPGNNLLGALFLIDAAGDPVDFTYARMHAPSPFLWRADHLSVHCQSALCAALFDICPTTPLVILCEANEVSPALFSERILIGLPVGRVSARNVAGEEALLADVSAYASVQWTDIPAAQSPARQLLDTISSRGLLEEPFLRAEAGLREVYADLFSS